MRLIFNEEIEEFALSLMNGADEALVARLCAAASEELLSRLREGVAPADIKDRFVMAAGVLALSMHTALGKGAPKSFKAGSVSMDLGERALDAETLRKSAEALLASYICDRGFEFLGVRG